MKSYKIKKVWIVCIVSIFILIILNPRYSNFKDFTGVSGNQSFILHKETNLLILSVCKNDIDDKKYIGILKNFVDITSKPELQSVLDSTVKEVDSVSSVHKEVGYSSITYNRLNLYSPKFFLFWLSLTYFSLHMFPSNPLLISF